MALLTLQQVVEPSLTPSYGAVAASDTVTPADRLFLHVKNGNASPDTVTIVCNTTGPGGIATPNVTVSVPATTGDRMIPLANPAYVSASTGLITVQHSVTATVTCALVRAP